MSKLLELLQEETKNAIATLVRDRVAMPHMLTQSLLEFTTSPEGAGWLFHMERQMFALARMGESRLEYIVLDEQHLNDVLSDPMCPVQSWYLDTVKAIGVLPSDVFESATSVVIRSGWKKQSPNGATLAAQVGHYLTNCMLRLEEAWKRYSNVPVRVCGHRLLFDWH